jgi:hypothetical protein
MASIERVPPVCDMDLYAGDGISISFTVVNSDQTPYPLDGVVTAWIKKKRTDGDPPLAEWSVDASQQDQGIVLLSLTGEQTEALVNGSTTFTGVWDMQFVKSGGQPMTLLQGKVTCNADVTH